MLERRDGTRHEAAPDAADHPAGGLLGLVLLATPAPAPAAADPAAAAPASVEVVASGLIYPRGLDFDPDGQLYVAEHGYGGDPSAGRILRIRLF
jgi:glucose/arabinose dehydrogenase